MGQVRCPNCGGFDATSRTTELYFLWLPCYVGLTVVTAGVGIVLAVPLWLWRWNSKVRGKHRPYVCNLCKFDFEAGITPPTSEPSVGRDGLRQMGVARRAEEEAQADHERRAGRRP